MFSVLAFPQDETDKINDIEFNIDSEEEDIFSKFHIFGESFDIKDAIG